MSAEQKKEKKIMDEKIAKVRSVVNNVSTNTIVLVLHHYELNVEKTIQAFLQGTYNEILDDWEQLPGGASAKSKNAKKKKSKAATKSADSGSLASGKSTPSALKPASDGIGNNGYHGAVAPTPATATAAVANNGVATKNNKSAPAAPSVQLNGGGQQPAGDASASSKKKNKSKQTGNAATAEVEPVSADELARFQALDDAAKLSVIAAEVGQLSSYASDLDKLEDAFNNQISHSQTNILQCFLAIKQLLSERERQLSAELAHCRDDAAALFNARRAKLIDLSGKAIAPPKAAKERETLYKELKSFNAAKAHDKSIANATRFHVDTASLHAAIARFGEVVPTKSSGKPSGNATNGGTTTTTAAVPTHASQAANGKPIKEPTTQPQKQPTAEQPKANGHHPVANGEKLAPLSGASEVSDVSSDLSPKVETKKATQVTTGGIQMQSNDLSADQLVALQKQIEETLRSKGIDPSVFANISGNIVAPRKRPPPKNGNNNSHSNGGEKRAGGKDGAKTGGGKSQQQQAKLSIMS